MSGSTAGGVLLIGGGGHALVVAEAAQAAGVTVAGFVDDDPACALAGVVERLGGLQALTHPELTDRHPSIVCVGSLELRRRLIGSLGAPFADIAHPSAVVSPTARLGGGVFVGPLAVVHAQAEVGAHAIVNTGAIVEHHCVVGVNTHIAPGAALGGEVRVGSDCLVGVGACALPGVRIGDGCTVGAGSVVIDDAPDGATIVGVPGRAVSV